MFDVSEPILVASPAITSDHRANRPSRMLRRFQQVAIVLGQLAALWGINLAGVWTVEKTGLPIPGNLVGMLALYALLTLGLVKIAWLDLAGSFLIKHLAFFFVPITVGLMDSGPLLLAHGVGIMLALTASAAFGILLAGFVSQALLPETLRRGEES